MTAQSLGSVKTGASIITGVASEYLKKLGKETGHRVIDVMEQDEIAILNAIPTAEGAIAIAIEHMPLTIYGAKSAVLGFDIVEKAIARTLNALGAHRLWYSVAIIKNTVMGVFTVIICVIMRRAPISSHSRI